MHRLPRSRPRTLRFETLEARRVMTVGVTAALNSAGVLNILGTDADEQVLFHETSSAISITGVSGAWLASKVKAINIDLKGGNDVVSLASKANGGKQALAENIAILSGSGNDRVLLASGNALNFNGLGNKLTVSTSGNAAVNGVALNWSTKVLVSLSSAGVLKVTGTNAADNLLFRQTGGKIYLSGVSSSWTATKVKSIVVYLQDGNDTVSLNSLADGGNQALQKAVTVYSGAGNDRVELADGHEALFSELGNTLLVSAAGTATLDGQVLNWSPAVSIPDLTAASDSGVSNTDNLTSVTMPTFSGTSAAGATVQLLEGTTVLGSTMADGSGNWSITASVLTDGVHQIAARASDLAGNQSTSGTLTITIDTLAPAVSIPDLAAASDSGSSNTDNLTKITVPVFTGTSAAGATVQLLEGATVLGSATADASGNWSITASALADGVYNLTARTTDAAGNQSTSGTLAVTIDTLAPVVSTPDLTPGSDSGVSNTDNMTSVITPVFTGTAEAGATVQLLEGTTVLGSATADASGNWSMTSSALAAGVHHLAARATDLAGNQSTSGTLAVTIDTLAPTVSVPDLTAASDSGSSNSDNLTNITTPVFVGTSAAGATVQLLEGTTVLGSATADASGNWSITSSALASGTHNISARSTDLAGNQSTSGTLGVTIDTAGPAISVPDLTAASDSGSSNSDQVTNDTTPTLSGTAEAGASVVLLDGSTVLGNVTANSSGNWTITSSVLATGVHNLTARATDAAGNQTTSAALAVTIDTTNPAVSTPDLAASADSGASSNDNVTNVTTPLFTGTAEAGATVQLLDGSTVLGTFTADGSGNWSITTGVLAGGTHSFVARATDLAGNQATSLALVVTIDTSAPTVSIPDLTAASDSGSSNTDNVTSITTPVFSGTAEAGATVQLLEGSTVLGTATANASGAWTITSSTLAGGVHNLTARATDLAGNQATSAALAVTIDTTSLFVSTPDLAAASDSGASSADNLTNITTPVFTGTATAGATVQLLDGANVVGSATADGSGNWSITSSVLASGVHNISATVADLAGNQSASAALVVTIDAAAPAVGKPDLTAASDSGSSNTDNLTNLTTPTFTGTAEGGATVQLLEGSTVLGSATADGSGNWTITSSALAEGVHNLAARATDAAGNTSAASSALAVTIDTSNPAISAPDLTAASDSGSSSSDNITNDNTPTVTGTAEVGALVQLLDGSSVVGSATADASGNWSITTSVLAGGTHNLTARATDLAGNQATSLALVVTIDTLAPSISVPDLTAASDDGTSNSDNLTSITTPTFTGTAEAGTTVQLLEGSTVLGSATADGSGNWSITASALASGVHNLTARATDLAGNQTTSGTLAVTIGTTTTTNWFDTNIQNSVIRTVGSQEFQDGLIDRNDMINLLRQVETSGSIDATEMSDLTLIVHTASLFGSLDYVDNLASKIVLGNTANAQYQGGTLGNLAVGSSATQLEELVDKWFLGTDHPAAATGYQTVSGPLFQNGVAYTDIVQGGLGDCGLMSALAEIAYRSPTTITSMFIVDGDGTYTVRFYHNGQADYVTIDSQLPSGYASIANELWVGLAEKAYAQINEEGWLDAEVNGQNSYNAIAGTYIFDALKQITSQSTIAFTAPSTANLTTFVNAFNAGKMIGFASDGFNTTDGVIASHAYAVIDYDPTTQSVTLFNPWGVGIGNGGLITLTWTEIQANFGYFDRTA